MPSRDDYAGAVGSFYSFYIAHRRLGRLLGHVIWDSDFEPLYRSLESLRHMEAATVVDVACGAGLALDWLDPTKVGRYVGIDNSPAMLARARRTARRRGHVAAELELADVAAIPLPEAVADLCLLYNSLHCLPSPEAAVAEAVRCLRPGGRLLGSMLVRRASRRADRLMEREAAKRRATMAAGGTEEDLHDWLRQAGLEDMQHESSAGRALAVFSARRGSAVGPAGIEPATKGL